MWTTANVTVQTEYDADANLFKLTALNAVTGNQTTTYIHGTTLADSEIATSTLKRKEVYPDSVDDDDVIKFAYNRQQQVTTVTDQGGTVHSYDFDKLGRQTQDRITSLGTGVDSAVRRIATQYEVRGMREAITSYDNATVGSGNVLNDCRFVYNNFGQLVTEYQSHSGAVNVSTTPKVLYGYADGSANTIRPTSLTYPNGRAIAYDYGTGGGVADRSSRVASIIDHDNTHLADYSYLGRQTFVIQDDTQPQIEWTRVDLAGSNDPDTGDIYSGLDRFGRVKDNRWYNYDSAADVDRIQYGYDRAGNRIWRKNVVAESLGKHFDELYGNDAIHRLKDMDRGTLTALKDAVTDRTFAQCWSLDPTGNWKKFLEDSDGNGTWDLNQSRAANPVNEITDVSETAGPTWVTPAYNRAGNMTTMPKVADPTVSQSCQYDAWNRLTKVSEGANTVAEYQYDGAKRRIVQKSYTAGVLSETRHLYYTEPSQWQVIEERVGTSPDSADAERQFVWGLRYIDDLVVRDRDTNGDGSLDERLYACQDANWNVTAIVDTTGAVQERDAYSVYGIPQFLTSTFDNRAVSSFDWEVLYDGYGYQAGSELFHVRNRVLHPMLGRWLQRDRFGYVDGLSLYEYCASRPVSGFDPLGTEVIECVCARQECVDTGLVYGCHDVNYTVDFDCQFAGVAKCCDWACGKDRWTGDWKIKKAKPDCDPYWKCYWVAYSAYYECLRWTNAAYEWTMFHDSNNQFLGTDLDGVLCDDWPGGSEDEQADAYLHFLSDARPKRIPSYPLGLIVTNRLERHRSQTEAWLTRHGIPYRALVMSPHQTFTDRDQAQDAAARKAAAYAAAPALWLFIESDDHQAQEIHRRTGRPVFSMARNGLV